jgi:hypothetical protein
MLILRISFPEVSSLVLKVTIYILPVILLFWHEWDGGSFFFFFFFAWLGIKQTQGLMHAR